MKKLLLFATFIILHSTFVIYEVRAQSKNMNLMDTLHYTFGSANDIWGYVDTVGTEYALVGLTTGLSVVELSDPLSPTQVAFLPGPQSTWRDIKTWSHYAYVTNESDSGLLIVDLSSLGSANPNLTFRYYQGGGLRSAHNLYIDENGICYLFGSNLGNRGVVMLDISTNPTAPMEVGRFDVSYVHDGVARGDTLYTAHIYEGMFRVVDVSDKTTPNVLGSATTPNNFTHNIWMSDDGDYVYTTDERTDSYIGAYDISDLTNIVEVDKEQSQNAGSGSIPHNTHFTNEYVVTSYYNDGITIHDVARPHNVILTGYYDTSPNSGNGFTGCWGTYPFLPSGLVIGSDRQAGLFVLGANYKRGCYLEGTVTDINTGLSISNVDIEIIGPGAITESNLMGEYATGVADSGSYNIRYQVAGYQTLLLNNVVLDNGVLTIRNVQMIPLTPFLLTSHVINDTSNNRIPNAQVRIFNASYNHVTTTNSVGNFVIPNFFAGDYEVQIGAWGYETICIKSQSLNGLGAPYTFRLQPGYYDDFTFDFNWTVSGNATDGIWERGVPWTSSYNGTIASPPRDNLLDCGVNIFGTNNSGGNAIDFDVDSGVTILTSPIFDLSNYPNPFLHYDRWFFYLDYNLMSLGTDSLKIFLSDGTNRIMIDFADMNDTTNGTWQNKSIRIKDFMQPTNNMQLIVEVSDNLDDHIIEAGFDFFQIADSLNTGIDDFELETAFLSVFPNPSNQNPNIKYQFEKPLSSHANLLISDVLGRTIQSILLNQISGNFTLQENLKAGVYFLKLNNGKEVSKTLKFVKME